MMNFQSKAFEEMKNLRLLELGHVRLNGDYKYLSEKFRWLCWRGFPSSHIPSNLRQGSLVAIDFRHSNLKLLWKDPLLLDKLKIINLSHSHQLIQTPNFSNLPNLQKLILKGCSKLTMVDETIGYLKSLVSLNLKDCKSLGNLPKSFYKLRSLKILILSGCPLIDTLEEDVEQMVSLTTLDAHGTSIKKVPFSIVKSSSLRFISLCGYEGSAPYLFPKIIWSWMSPGDNCSALALSSRNMTSQVSFLCRNSFLTSLSEISGQILGKPSHLGKIRDLARALNLLYCTNSQNSEKFLKTPAVHIGSCYKVTTLASKNVLQTCNDNSCGDSIFTTDKYSDCFTYKDQGPSVCFEVPQTVGSILQGVAICITFSSEIGQMQAEHLICVINHTKGTIQISKLFTFKEDTITTKSSWKKLLSNIESGDRIEVIVDFKVGVTVTMTEVHLVYSTTKRLNME